MDIIDDLLNQGVNMDVENESIDTRALESYEEGNRSRSDMPAVGLVSKKAIRSSAVSDRDPIRKEKQRHPDRKFVLDPRFKYPFESLSHEDCSTLRALQEQVDKRLEATLTRKEKLVRKRQGMGTGRQKTERTFTLRPGSVLPEPVLEHATAEPTPPLAAPTAQEHGGKENTPLASKAVAQLSPSVQQPKRTPLQARKSGGATGKNKSAETPRRNDTVEQAVGHEGWRDFFEIDPVLGYTPEGRAEPSHGGEDYRNVKEEMFADDGLMDVLPPLMPVDDAAAGAQPPSSDAHSLLALEEGAAPQNNLRVPTKLEAVTGSPYARVEKQILNRKRLGDDLPRASQRRKASLSNRRFSLAGAGTVLQGTVRRSTRIRLPCLRWYMNERPIYGREHKTLPTITGVVLTHFNSHRPGFEVPPVYRSASIAEFAQCDLLTLE